MDKVPSFFTKFHQNPTHCRREMSRKSGVDRQIKFAGATLALSLPDSDDKNANNNINYILSIFYSQGHFVEILLKDKIST